MDHFENLNTDTENSAGAKLGNLACRVNQFILHLEAVKIFWAVIWNSKPSARFFLFFFSTAEVDA